MRTGLLARVLPALGSCLFASLLYAQDTPQPPQPPPQILSELALQGATIFTRDDVLWLLRLEPGQRLPESPDGIAGQLERRYHRDGYTAARVSASFDTAAGRLTLIVDEGKIDDIEVRGVPSEFAAKFRDQLAGLDVRPGDVYNRRTVGRAVRKLVDDREGALDVGNRGSEGPDEVDVVERNGRRILVVPLRQRRSRVSISTSTREDLYNPVDGFSPGIGFQATAYDHQVNYTFVGGYLAQKFAAERGSYSIGIERGMFARPRLAFGAEIHDITASDDLWRLSTVEQTLASIALKDTYRDYYRRHGYQLHAALRAGRTHEIVASWRSDRHDPLQNETTYSFFDDDDPFRPNAPTVPADLNALVLTYTFDSRGLTDVGIPSAFERHLVDDLFRGSRRQAFGWRADWTTEIAGHGFGGDYTFERHIANARAYVPLSPRQSLAVRGMLGFSRGALPVERTFALGGIGTVHGYDFKAFAGDRMQLFNAEYRIDFFGDGRNGRAGPLRGLVFYDAGRAEHPPGGGPSEWLQGIGIGVQILGVRVEWGYRLDDVPKSLQILIRLSPTF